MPGSQLIVGVQLRIAADVATLLGFEQLQGRCGRREMTAVLTPPSTELRFQTPSKELARRGAAMTARAHVHSEYGTQLT